MKTQLLTGLWFAIASCFFAAPSALAETDDRLLRARVYELRSAVERCQQRIANNEIDECTVRIRWENREVSMAEASELADELEPVPGRWVEYGRFSQVNVACLQLYRCQPSGAVMRGQNSRIVTTPQESVWGACSTAGGDPEGCNVCISRPPSRACTWHVER